MSLKLISWSLRLVGILLTLAAVVGAGVWGLHVWHNSPVKGAESYEEGEHTSSAPTPVDVLAPRADSSFSMSVTQPAYVEPYYRIDLRARVAGPVMTIRKDIGDTVKTGEVLLTISVPDLEEDIARKEAVVKQRERERDVSLALTKKAEADVEIARSTIREKQAEVGTADSMTAFRKQELARFRGLAQDEAVTGNIVAERQKFYEAAAAGSAGARAAVDRAKAEELGAKAKLQEAQADEQLKDALIDVARKDLAVAKAMLGFATLTAPFDGVVTRRNVDPGSFVQSSANSVVGPGLLTLEKTDLVTIYMSLPDSYAPYVDDKTEAVLEMSELPGVLIRAKVTRTSASLNTPSHDRTMRVEVDLFNRGPNTYKAFLEREKAGKYADLKGGKLPIFPEVTDKLKENLGIQRLLPGMYGTMQLVLRNFKNASLIPSSTVFSKGGKPYIYLVKDDVARLTPVEVQVDDGVLAKVQVIQGTGKTARRRELNANDRIVQSNQGELSDGQAVQPNLVSW
jgi:multidrug efflux pump subunit AcrA (membrane-fusion protein)